MVKKGLPLEGTLLNAARATQPDSPSFTTCCCPYFCAVNVNRAFPHVWVEGILIEQDSAASKVGEMKRFATVSCCR